MTVQCAPPGCPAPFCKPRAPMRCGLPGIRVGIALWALLCCRVALASSPFAEIPGLGSFARHVSLADWDPGAAEPPPPFSLWTRAAPEPSPRQPAPRRMQVRATGQSLAEVAVAEAGPRVQGACATGAFYPSMRLLGWHFLALYTDASCPDVAQAYAAGYVEGSMTHREMWQHFRNEFGSLEPSEALQEYLARNMDFLETRIQELFGDQSPRGSVGQTNKTELALWWQVNLILAQLKGLEAGYRANAPPSRQLAPLAFQILSLHGDIQDLQYILGHAAPSWPSAQHLVGPTGLYSEHGSSLRRSAKEQNLGSHAPQGPPKKARRSRGSTQAAGSGQPNGLPLVYPDSCSALVKVLPGNSDILVSQATWTRLETMLRVFKLYRFQVHVGPTPGAPLVPGHSMAFSSYPGRLFSGDDFYIISSGLIVQETTIGNSNMDLYRKYVRPEGTILEWMRNLAANRVAASGAEWVEVFRQRNSGTYNNQWMVVDTSRFRAGSPPPAGTLWVLEQIPGHIEAEDATAVLLAQSYWASYNIPYFPGIFNLSGFARLEREYGEFFSYTRNARARMFRRDHSKVVDVAILQALMRYNDYLHDPLSHCNCTPPHSAELAIAARGDLNPGNGSYSLPFLGLRDHAETDAKISRTANSRAQQSSKWCTRARNRHGVET